MWDLGMQPSLAAIAADSAEALSLLVLLFVAIVGLAASLVILEAIHYYRFRRVSPKATLLLRRKGDLRWQNLMS